MLSQKFGTASRIGKANATFLNFYVSHGSANAVFKRWREILCLFCRLFIAVSTVKEFLKLLQNSTSRYFWDTVYINDDIVKAKLLNRCKLQQLIIHTYIKYFARRISAIVTKGKGNNSSFKINCEIMMMELHLITYRKHGFI